MALYLDALCWRVETAFENAGEISRSLRIAVQEVASEMAKKGSDFFKRGRCHPID